MTDMETFRLLARTCFPARGRDTHKGTYGHLQAVCGSASYRGAATLAAKGALAVGAGLVTVCAADAALAAVCANLPEAIPFALPAWDKMNGKDVARVAALAGDKSAVLIGCGCTTSDALLSLILGLLGTSGAPLVLDADALNALSTLPDPASTIRRARRSVILTPHPAEFARLRKTTVDAVQADRVTGAAAFARETGAVVVLKGSGTVVASPDGQLLVDSIGSPALAKGGTGDALAGMIAGLCAQGRAPFTAAAVGVHLHSRAGACLAEEYSEYGVMPSDLPACASKIIRSIQKEDVN